MDSKTLITILRAVDDEPELPGDMPDEMWKTLKDCNRETLHKVLVIVVQLTKKGIRERILALAGEKDSNVTEIDKQYYFLDIDGIITKKNEDLVESDSQWNSYGTLLYVTTADYFDNTGAQADWTEICVFEALLEGGFFPLKHCDGVIEFAGVKVDNEALKNFLVTHPSFEGNIAFEKLVT